jgi:hypothetical protein
MASTYWVEEACGWTRGRLEFIRPINHLHQKVAAAPEDQVLTHKEESTALAIHINK